MSLQLLTWRPEAAQTPNMYWRSLKRSATRRHRAVSKYFRSQYYLSTALAGTRQAVRRNEDITLGGLVIIACLSFAAISIFGNAVYQFILAASILSALSGINIALLATAAIAVISVMGLWLGAFTQNIWMYALYEGSTRKQHKSLRRTIRLSLRHTSRTALAWSGLLFTAVAPGAISNVLLLAVAKVFHVHIIGILPYIVVLEVVTLVWAGWVLTTYCLLPQVALFSTHTSFKDAATQARQLVSRKGRVFALSNYAACFAGLGAAYLIAWLIHAATNASTALTWAFLSMVPLSLMNANLTMLYRKRRLARA